MIHDNLLAYLNELREDFYKKTDRAVFKIDPQNHLSASGIVHWKQKKFDPAQQTEAYMISIADPIEQKWPGAVLTGSVHAARKEDGDDTQRGNIKFGSPNLGR